MVDMAPVAGSAAIITNTAIVNPLFAMPRFQGPSLWRGACRRELFLAIVVLVVIMFTSGPKCAEKCDKAA
jgi:hypothetical protein